MTSKRENPFGELGGIYNPDDDSESEIDSNSESESDDEIIHNCWEYIPSSSDIMARDRKLIDDVKCGRDEMEKLKTATHDNFLKITAHYKTSHDMDQLHKDIDEELVPLLDTAYRTLYGIGLKFRDRSHDEERNRKYVDEITRLLRWIKLLIKDSKVEYYDDLPIIIHRYKHFFTDSKNQLYNILVQMAPDKYHAQPPEEI
jgi:hypothetical protein